MKTTLTSTFCLVWTANLFSRTSPLPSHLTTDEYRPRDGDRMNGISHSSLFEGSICMLYATLLMVFDIHRREGELTIGKHPHGMSSTFSSPVGILYIGRRRRCFVVM